MYGEDGCKNLEWDAADWNLTVLRHSLKLKSDWIGSQSSRLAFLINPYSPRNFQGHPVKLLKQPLDKPFEMALPPQATL